MGQRILTAVSICHILSMAAAPLIDFYLKITLNQHSITTPILNAVINQY